MNDARAVEFLAVLSHDIDGIVIKRLPIGMGRVVTQSGAVLEVSHVFIKPSSMGLRTAFSILDDHPYSHKYYVE